MSDKPIVLFVCVHNAGRSQMAAGFLRELSGGSVEVRAGGSEPGDRRRQAARRSASEGAQRLAGDGVTITDAAPDVEGTTMTQLPAVILGVGPVGLAAVAQLLHRGVEPLVLAQRSKAGAAILEPGL